MQVVIGVGSATVLVVDDDYVFLDVVKRMLLREGYQVLPSACPSEALETVRKLGAVDVVLSDIIMPEMPGTELVREIGEVSPRIARVLMTAGHVDSANLPDGVPVLQKPFSRWDLICAVEAALARSAPMNVTPKSQ